MPRGGQAWDGEVIHAHQFNGGGGYEYRLVAWEDQPRIAIRWNAGPEIANMPPGIHTSVTLPAELYPAIIENILPPDVRARTSAFLGPELANGNYPGPGPNPNQNYIHPQDVTAPRNLLGPFKVVMDNRAGDGAYMIGKWGDRQIRAIAFRWNGTNTEQRGFPISKGHPVWIILPDDLRGGFSGPGPFVDILPPDMGGSVIEFLTGQRNPP